MLLDLPRTRRLCRGVSTLLQKVIAGVLKAGMAAPMSAMKAR